MKSSTINSIHCGFLLPQQWISVSVTRRGGCLSTTFGATATIGLRPLSSCRVPIFFSARGRLFSPYVIHTPSLPKLTQNFPFLQGWFFSGQRLVPGMTSCNLLFPAHHLFWLVISPILAFISFFPSLVRKINFNAFVIFLLAKNETIYLSLSSFSWWQYIASQFRK